MKLVGDSSQGLGKTHVSKIKDISNRLMNSHYKFSASRKILISKKDTIEKHFLTIMFFWDKVVAYSIYILLQHVFEGLWYNPQLKATESIKKVKNRDKSKPIFLAVSHGFRPSKSCHTALYDVQTWGLCSWFMCDLLLVEGKFNNYRNKKQVQD